MKNTNLDEVVESASQVKLSPVEYLKSEVERLKEGKVDWEYVKSGGKYVLGGAAAAAIGTLVALGIASHYTAEDIRQIYQSTHMITGVIQPLLQSQDLSMPIQAYLSHVEQACQAIKGQIKDAANFVQNQKDCIQGSYFKAIYEGIMQPPEKIASIGNRLINERIAEFREKMPLFASAGGAGGGSIYIAGTELVKKIRTTAQRRSEAYAA